MSLGWSGCAGRPRGTVSFGSSYCRQLRHPAWYLEHCRFAAMHRYDRSRVENGSALRKLEPTRMTISNMGDDFAVMRG